MEAIAVGRPQRSQEEPRLALLLADDDAGVRALMATLARARIAALAVLEVADGADAVDVGLRRRPQIAVLDVAMPRLGGVDAALALRELEPQMRVAVYGADPVSHRDRARKHGLPLFDKLDLGRTLDWVERQAQAGADRPSPRSHLPRKLSLECSSCGYGIARATPPERCPMCQREGPWSHTPWRPFSRELGPAEDIAGA